MATMEQTVRQTFENGEQRQGGTEVERAELAAFFRELGLGWDYDAENLVERIAAPRGRR